MEQQNWKESLREFEYDIDGNLKPKRIVCELEKKENSFTRKDYFDFSLRLVSALAIFIPLIIFIQQQKAETRKQKSIYQTEVFTGTISELHLIEKTQLNTSDFVKHKEKLISELYPKILITNNQNVIDTFNVIYDILNFSSIMTEAYGSLINLRFGSNVVIGTDSSFIVPIYYGYDREQEFLKSYSVYKEWKPSSLTSLEITDDFRKQSLKIFDPIAELLPIRGVDSDTLRKLQWRISNGIDSAKVISYKFSEFIKSNLKKYIVNFDSLCLRQIIIDNR